MDTKLAIKVFELLMLERDDIRRLKVRVGLNDGLSLSGLIVKMEDRVIQLMELVKKLIEGQSPHP